jgi:hypothetical protein
MRPKPEIVGARTGPRRVLDRAVHGSGPPWRGLAYGPVESHKAQL